MHADKNLSHTQQTHILTSGVRTKFPNATTTVFTLMSQLATQHGAINLGQGFPDFQPDPQLLAAVTQAMNDGINQYAPMTGLPSLRNIIAKKIRHFGGRQYDPNEEITVTAGATEALTSSLLALVHPGDEVIVFEPTYDSYIPAIELAGGKAVTLPLNAQYMPDWRQVSAVITQKTRGVVFNNPHNPCASVWSESDLDALGSLAARHGLWVLADEVYEHMVFDGKQHTSVANHPVLAECSVLVSSFGKSLHVTGWKIAYVAAPAVLSKEIRQVHQYNTFSVATPLQAGIARYLETSFEPLEQLPAFYQRKRDYFREALAQLPLRLLPCSGTYFQVADYRAISDLDDVTFSRWMTQKIGVTCIPMSAFNQGGKHSGQIRFCFAKQESTLLEAVNRLQALK